jgi:hypothetical protein
MTPWNKLDKLLIWNDLFLGAAMVSFGIASHRTTFYQALVYSRLRTEHPTVSSSIVSRVVCLSTTYFCHPRTQLLTYFKTSNFRYTPGNPPCYFI